MCKKMMLLVTLIILVLFSFTVSAALEITDQTARTMQQTAPLVTETAPTSLDSLLVGLEINRLNRTNSWVNIYLTSSSHSQVYGISSLRFLQGVVPNVKFVKAELHPLFKNVVATIEQGGVNIVFSGPGSFPIAT
mgnify:CR=1 FL=1